MVTTAAARSGATGSTECLRDDLSDLKRLGFLRSRRERYDVRYSLNLDPPAADPERSDRVRSDR
jgi:hypothetical protein